MNTIEQRGEPQNKGTGHSLEHGAAEGSFIERSLPDMNVSQIGSLLSPLNIEFSSVTEIANNKKCSVWLAKGEEKNVIVKTLITDEPFYRNTFLKEVAVYEAFRDTPPAMGIPEILQVHREPLAIVMEYISSKKLSSERYPTADEWKDIQLDRVFDVLDSLRSYRGYPLGSSEEVLQRYHERWAKYIARNVYLESDKEVLAALARTPGWSPEFNHGDVIPGNILIDESEIFLIDWEFGGSFVPLYDAAVLWAIASRAPDVQARIEKRYLSGAAVDQLCFAANVLNVASRELWIHMELPDGHPIKEPRLQFLNPLIPRARQIISNLID